MKIKSVAMGAVAAVFISGCANQRQPSGNASAANPHSAAPQAQVASARQSSQPDPQQQSLIALATRAGGPAGGWIIGANPRNLSVGRDEAAKKSNQSAEQRPASLSEVNRADTADLNNDGFVTLDEVLALKQAGLSDQEMLARLRATGDVFFLNDRQMQYLADRGIPKSVIQSISGRNVDVGARTAVLVPENSE